MSWPDLFRPSTSFLLKCRKKGMDGRDERGHDAAARSRRKLYPQVMAGLVSAIHVFLC
jgi:hypothetical protein